MGDKHKDPWYLNPFIDFLMLLLLVITAPVVINKGLESWNLTSAPSLDNTSWLGFWGSYAGSALGVLATLVAFSFTYYQNNKQNRQIQEQNNQIQKQNVETKELMKQQMRLQSLPFININITGWLSVAGSSGKHTIMLNNDGEYYLSDPRNFSQLDCDIVNIGSGPAIDIRMSSFYIGHLVPDRTDKGRYTLLVPKSPGFIEKIMLSYLDREGRKYNQTFSLKFKEPDWVCTIVPPTLIQDIDPD
ncbi:hypothetical protein DSECCO2_307550 [anaerobic digester metagenome]